MRLVSSIPDDDDDIGIGQDAGVVLGVLLGVADGVSVGVSVGVVVGVDVRVLVGVLLGVLVGVEVTETVGVLVGVVVGVVVGVSVGVSVGVVVIVGVGVAVGVVLGGVGVCQILFPKPSVITRLPVSSNVSVYPLVLTPLPFVLEAHVDLPFTSYITRLPSVCMTRSYGCLPIPLELDAHATDSVGFPYITRLPSDCMISLNNPLADDNCKLFDNVSSAMDTSASVSQIILELPSVITRLQAFSRVKVYPFVLTPFPLVLDAQVGVLDESYITRLPSDCITT